MSEIDHLPVLPDKLGKVLTHYFFAIVCQNPKSDMPAPCCTQTQDPNQPPAGRPIPASSESEMRTCIRLCFSDALRGVLRHEKARQGTEYPNGLKTQNTASYDCNAKWERPYLALPNLYTSANSFQKKNSSTLPTLVRPSEKMRNPVGSNRDRGIRISPFSAVYNGKRIWYNKEKAVSA